MRFGLTGSIENISNSWSDNLIYVNTLGDLSNVVYFNLNSFKSV